MEWRVSVVGPRVCVDPHENKLMVVDQVRRRKQVVGLVGPKVEVEQEVEESPPASQVPVSCVDGCLA